MNLYIDYTDAGSELVRGVTDVTPGDGVVWYTTRDGARVGVYCDGYVVLDGDDVTVDARDAQQVED